ncbi:hypothetical protein H5119_07435 [Pseudoalteromonas sp. SG45-5]|uniref:hypothetical protein n=1 Tax=unclassified Pseudoalteromonas TaxID=194690 RepID=UPI0015FDF123|nr:MULTISPECIES: hypothetical protein [unclassified Pseudoalteromonas]MBB1385366.1 hypothetical protein [Pseudoalteromonas sp. SG45-5]MBB1393292.1 hypothetical protein [Pseudoalteromonas sp. SG44-4]MBB1446581.1 hypothetical protein [Pseudoalteromonas sp. SG41-6]
MELNYLYIGFGVIALLNVIVSEFLVKRDDLEVFQKAAQILLVWLIPLFAAIGLWLFYRTQDRRVNVPKSFGGGAGNSTNIGGGF